MKPVVWGVLSTARIGIQQVIPAMRASPLIELRAIASRSLSAAEGAARSLGIAQAYGSYEELLADPAIEAIYNPLPNHLHVPLTLQAAAAGKHVLCEKPVALSAAQAELLRAASCHVHIEEAFMVRHHPQWLRARELVRAGRIGTPQAVQVFFRTSTMIRATSATSPASAVGRCSTLVAMRFWRGAICSSASLCAPFRW